MTNSQKIAFITGTSSGIGAAIVDHLCKNDWLVIGTVRKEIDATELAFKFPQHYFPLVYDVNNQSGLTEMVNEARKHIGDNGLQLLINNAGIAVAGPLETLSDEELELQLDVNVKTVFRLTNAFIPDLIKSQNGKIINMGSISGLFVSPFIGAYAISKFALEAMTDAYRRELMPFSVKVFCLEPGPIRTPIWKKSADISSKFLASRYEPYLKNFQQLTSNVVKNAKPVEEVIQVIDRILKEETHKSRHVIAANKFFYHVLRHLLPTAFIDKMIKKKLYK